MPTEIKGKMNRPIQLKTLKVFDLAVNAHLLRTKLESEGICAVILDEHSISMNPLNTIAIGGVKLCVNEPDLEKAKNILKEIENTPYTHSDDSAIACPNCDSTDLISGFKSMRGKKGFLSALLSFLFLIFPIYYKTVYKCKKCNEEFNSEELKTPNQRSGV